MLIDGGHIVVSRCNRLLWPEHGEPTAFKTGKGNRTGDFVDQVTVDIQYAGTLVNLFNNMTVPYFVK